MIYRNSTDLISLQAMVYDLIIIILRVLQVYAKFLKRLAELNNICVRTGLWRGKRTLSCLHV